VKLFKLKSSFLLALIMAVLCFSCKGGKTESPFNVEVYLPGLIRDIWISYNLRASKASVIELENCLFLKEKIKGEERIRISQCQLPKDLTIMISKEANELRNKKDPFSYSYFSRDAVFVVVKWPGHMAVRFYADSQKDQSFFKTTGTRKEDAFLALVTELPFLPPKQAIKAFNYSWFLSRRQIVDNFYKDKESGNSIFPAFIEISNPADKAIILSDLKERLKQIGKTLCESRQLLHPRRLFLSDKEIEIRKKVYEMAEKLTTKEIRKK